MKHDTLHQSVKGDIKAFHELFLEFRPQLKSFLYRLLTDRNDVEDITQDTFVRAFDSLKSFRHDSSLKTWVFRIAANLARDHTRKQRRWQTDAQDRSKALASSTPEIAEEFLRVHRQSDYGRYEIVEHIDFCFNCISRTLTVEQQTALILKEMYDFSRKEISFILNCSEGVVKHLLHDARKILTEIFHVRCALINKDGACHQCTELAGYFNPELNTREASMKLEMVRESGFADRKRLYELRVALVSMIDPVRSEGSELQDVIMQCTRQANGEIEAMQINPKQY
jgi:RNA polymerase sigma-70 factor, ECF subfamily